MKTVIILSLASSSLAVPFSNVLNILGDSLNARHGNGNIPAPDVPSLHTGYGNHKTKQPIKPTGTIGVPCATGTGTGFHYPTAPSGKPTQFPGSIRSSTWHITYSNIPPKATPTPDMPIVTPSPPNGDWSYQGPDITPGYPAYPEYPSDTGTGGSYPTGIVPSGSGGYGYGSPSTLSTYTYTKPKPTPNTGNGYGYVGEAGGGMEGNRKRGEWVWKRVWGALGL